MELTIGPFEKLSHKTNKGKKPAHTPRGKEEREKMKYEFHGVDHMSKITSN